MTAPASTATRAAPKKAAPRVAPLLTGIRTDLQMPVRPNTRGSKSLYLFDELEVGTSFGVKNKKAESMTSIISNQNRKTYPLLKDGAPVMKVNEIKDANGNVVGTTPTGEPETFQKHFFAVDVDAKKDPDGASVRVWRDK